MALAVYVACAGSLVACARAEARCAQIGDARSFADARDDNTYGVGAAACFRGCAYVSAEHRARASATDLLRVRAFGAA